MNHWYREKFQFGKNSQKFYSPFSQKCLKNVSKLCLSPSHIILFFAFTSCNFFPRNIKKTNCAIFSKPTHHIKVSQLWSGLFNLNNYLFWQLRNCNWDVGQAKQFFSIAFKMGNFFNCQIFFFVAVICD